MEVTATRPKSVSASKPIQRAIKLSNCYRPGGSTPSQPPDRQHQPASPPGRRLRRGARALRIGRLAHPRGASLPRHPPAAVLPGREPRPVMLLPADDRGLVAPFDQERHGPPVSAGGPPAAHRVIGGPAGDGPKGEARPSKQPPIDEAGRADRLAQRRRGVPGEAPACRQDRRRRRVTLTIMLPASACCCDPHMTARV